jgi:hypothetical protein
MNPSIAPHCAMLSHGVASLLMVIVVATVTLLYSFYVPKNITIISNAHSSEVMLARLTTQITSQRVAKLSLKALYAEVKKNVSSARAITIAHDRPYHVTVFVDTMTPCAVINNEHVLTHGGSLVPLEEYGTDTINQLGCITVAEQFFSEQSRVACSTWIAQLPAEILKSFSITWYARSHIELVSRDHNLSGLVFITWCYTDFSPEIMAVMERVAQKHKRIDLRVPHYAIVSPILRGNL